MFFLFFLHVTLDSGELSWFFIRFSHDIFHLDICGSVSMNETQSFKGSEERQNILKRGTFIVTADTEHLFLYVKTDFI